MANVHHSGKTFILERLQCYVPNLITYYISRIPNVRVVHIGPEPYHIDRNLEGRYLWLHQLDPKRYQVYSRIR